MKQIIKKYPNGDISCKYYINHLNKMNGLYIYYLDNGIVYWKVNYLNGKRFGLYTVYYNNSKPTQITYHL